MKNLFQLLSAEVDSEIEEVGLAKMLPDFRMSIQEKTEDYIRIIIHPFGFDGDTLDYYIKED